MHLDEIILSEEGRIQNALSPHPLQFWSTCTFCEGESVVSSEMGEAGKLSKGRLTVYSIPWNKLGGRCGVTYLFEIMSIHQQFYAELRFTLTQHLQCQVLGHLYS